MLIYCEINNISSQNRQNKKRKVSKIKTHLIKPDSFLTLLIVRDALEKGQIFSISG